MPHVHDSLFIEGAEYDETKHGEFHVPLESLRSLRFNEVPCYSTVKVTHLPRSSSVDGYELSITATHAGCLVAGNEDFMILFHVQHSATAAQLLAFPGLSARRNSTIKKVFAELVGAGLVREQGGLVESLAFHTPDGGVFTGVSYFRTFDRSENPILSEYVIPFADRFRRLLETPTVYAFICHASEDKAFVDTLADALGQLPLSVWYDKREIKVGDSIVERVEQGLHQATHLLVVLSGTSVSKPWLKRELSSTLMRQLSKQPVKILPLLINDCRIPHLLVDIKYADFRADFRTGFEELVAALFAE